MKKELVHWKTGLKKITTSTSQGDKKSGIEDRMRRTNFPKKMDNGGEAISEELLAKIFPASVKDICSQSRKHNKY